MRNRLIFDGGFDGGFVNFGDGFYSYTIFYLLKSGLFMQKNNLTTYALAKNQGFNSPRLHQPKTSTNGLIMRFVEVFFLLFLRVESGLMVVFGVAQQIIESILNHLSS